MSNRTKLQDWLASGEPILADGAMGNVGDASCAGALDELAADPDAGVAEHAAWGRRRLEERLGEGG